MYVLSLFSIASLNHYLYNPGRQYIKDVLIDGQSHLLIIREETELPGAQVSWETDLSLDLNESVLLLCIACSLSALCSVRKLARCGYPGLQFGKRGQFPGSVQDLPSTCRPPPCHRDTFRSRGHTG